MNETANGSAQADPVEHQAVALRKQFESLVRQVPTRSEIFLPTEKIPLSEKVRGMQHVAKIYERDLDAVYRPRIRALRDQCNGTDRCFIIGNGPSLNRIDLSQLKNEVTFAVNGFFLKTQELDWFPTFYVVEDHLVAEDRKLAIDAFKGPTKLFPAYLGYCFDASPDTIFFNHQPRKSYPEGFDFSTDASNITYAGCTVTFTCMQLAYYLGFKEIYLIGVDADYALPADVEQSKSYGVGVLDMKSDDPNHFHPDYFGKGYRWHDPQVDKMVLAYTEARRVTEQAGRPIRNAGVGGKLELFERVPFQTLFPVARSLKELESARANSSTPQAFAGVRSVAITEPAFPRLLVIDSTLMGDGTATGEVKRALLQNWPEDRLLQVYGARGNIAVNGPVAAMGIDIANITDDDSLELSRGFSPQAILYRPLPNAPNLHHHAMNIIDSLDAPLAIWIMDDWPGQLESEQSPDFAMWDGELRSLLHRSALRLSICDQMSEVFEGRYGVAFDAFANGIDPDEWPSNAKPRSSAPVKIRYAGSLAENMTLASVTRIAEAIDELATSGLHVTFEIKTSDYWLKQIGGQFDRFKGTSINAALLSPEEYRKWISDADIVTIAYNFDSKSRAYVGYSLANKLPECLASGAATFVHGPSGLPTVDHVIAHDCASVALEENVDSVVHELRQLVLSDKLRRTWALKGRNTAISIHDVRRLREKLRAKIANMSKPESVESEASTAVTSAYPRSAEASLDETEVVSRIFAEVSGPGRVMIDVGAHYGSSAKYFADLGWTVHCFEPDPANREKLLKKFGTSATVTVDPRAVGEIAETGRSFYKSAESTGISSLNPFRDSHEEAGKVDITTVADVIQDRGLKRIDFLKIDVEGWDFAVLKGVPWDTMKPEVVECEFEDAKTIKMGVTYRDIANFLVEKGYTVYVSEWHPIIQYGIKHQWYRLKSYPCDLASDQGWGNLVAFLNDPGRDKVGTAFGSCLRTKTAMKYVPAAPGKPGPSTGQSLQSRTGSVIAAISPKLLQILRTAKHGVIRFSQNRALLTASGTFVAALFGIGVLLPSLVPAISVAAIAAFGLFWLAVAVEARAAKVVTELRSRIVTLERRAATAESRSAAFREELKRRDACIRKQLPEGAQPYQTFSRFLEADGYVPFEKKWSKLLDLPLKRSSLAYEANRIRAIEEHSQGRLATSIENALLRCMVARSVKREELEILEIGSLFGIGLSIMHDATRGYFRKVRLTALDPLSGYYGAGNLDKMLDIPVNQDVFWHNMRVADIERDSVTLIPHLSTDEAALKAAGAARYDILVIDGDHSHQGVKFDFDNYVGFVRPGGFVLIDDYSNIWPDVKRFVDEEAVRDPRVELVGIEWTTALFRVLKSEQAA